MDKYLSVITNFGCHYSCPYCIVKNNGLRIPVTTIQGLDNLHDAIINNRCNWVSVSGGGDPLHEYEKHIDWHQSFFACIPKGIKTELHTSYIRYGGNTYAPYDRVVYHLKDACDIDVIRRYNGQIVRVVFVVTEQYTKELIDYIADKVESNPYIDELSFRQMIDDEYKVTHYCEEYLKVGHKKRWYYIEQNDYNLYYAENKISYKYEGFK